jgi:hypothetical protein
MNAAEKYEALVMGRWNVEMKLGGGPCRKADPQPSNAAPQLRRPAGRAQPRFAFLSPSKTMRNFK